MVVGGISGLAAAYYYRQQHGRRARVLILEAPEDFGGHAHRNEFHVRGRTLLSNGGTVNLDTPSTWSKQARSLITRDRRGVPGGARTALTRDAVEGVARMPRATPSSLSGREAPQATIM